MKIPTFKEDSLLIFIDPFAKNVREDKKDIPNKYSTKVLEYIKEPTNNINYLFVCAYDSLSFIKNEKWCGKTSKRISLENRVFTTKVVDYKLGRNFSNIYCSSLDSKFDEFNYKNILTTSAFFTKDLADFLDTFPNIKNVIIAGEAWELCIRFRPLGLLNVVNLLKNYKNVNVIVDFNLIGGMEKTAFLNKSKKSVVKEPCWKHVEGSMFYLPKDQYDIYLEKYIDVYQEKYPKNYQLEMKDIHLELNDYISARHLTLDLFDEIVSKEDFQ